MRILYLGTIGRDGTSRQRFRILSELGHEVVGVESGSLCFQSRLRPIKVFFNRTHRYVDWRGLNRHVISLVKAQEFDLLWADKVLTIRPETLKCIGALRPAMRMISYSPDDMLNPRNQSRHYRGCIPLYDRHGTTKSYNVAELKQLGARDVQFVHNAFDPATHRPCVLSEAERSRYAADLSFVGHFERERWEMLLRLAAEGFDVSVRGPGWPLVPEGSLLRLERGWFEAAEYAKIVSAAKINLCFLRRENRDLQTQRSVEIPACGGFLLAERTAEHRALFEEGKEATFFGDFAELVQQCRFYLANPEKRQEIAMAGHQRALSSDYSYHAQLQRILTDSQAAGGSDDQILPI